MYYLFSFAGLVLVIIFGVILNNLSKVRFKKGRAELKDISELPPYLKDLFMPYEKQLQDLGFVEWM